MGNYQELEEQKNKIENKLKLFNERKVKYGMRGTKLKER